MAALSNQQYEAFALEVAAFTPPERAYEMAGFKSSKKSSRSNASRLLDRPEIAGRVEELRAAYQERCALHLEYIQSLLLPVAEANALDYFEQDQSGKTKLKSFDKLDRRHGAAISSIKLNDDGDVIEIRFHNKNDAAKALMTSIGVKDTDHSSHVFLLSLGQRLSETIAFAEHASLGALPSPSSIPADSDVISL